MISWYVAQASSYAPDVDSLIVLIALIVGPFFLAAELALFWLIFKFRARPGVKARYITGEKTRERRWVVWPHYLVLAFDIIIVVAALRVWNDVKIDLPPQRSTFASSRSSGRGPSFTRDQTASSTPPTTSVRWTY